MNTEAQILSDLTAEQKSAVTHFRGPMLVVAGAGSGKTRVVTCRIAWLLTQGVKAWQILALTFTNKAAGEMQARVKKFIGETPKSVGTFHSICARFLRYDVARLNEGRNNNFTIYDADEQQSLLKHIVKDFHLDAERFKARNIAENISRAKCQLISPADYAPHSWHEEKIAAIYAEYEKRLRYTNAVDFDDLLLLTARMLEQLPDLRTAYQRRYPFLLVDEYQDTNRLQYKLLRLLCAAENNIHATGDPDQSIYSWRGADYRNIMDFQRDFNGAKIVRLERNYRSTGNILHAANELIKHNEYRLEKNLFTEDEVGEKIILQNLPADKHESEWIAQHLRELRQAGAKLSTMAIFYRVNAQSRSLEEALMSNNIPYQIVGGVRFYERREIRDALAHLKLRVNPFDENALIRIVGCRPTGVGEKTLAQIFAQARSLNISSIELLTRADFKQIFAGRGNAKLQKFCAWCQTLMQVPIANAQLAVQQIIELSGLSVHLHTQLAKDPLAQDRLENLDALINRASEFSAQQPEADLAQFLTDVALVADIDHYHQESDSVTLMTLHSAKGLEFDNVFLVGLEEGILPHKNSLSSRDGLDEERRLFYVGITRAKKRLFISFVDFRMLHGEFIRAEPSKFLRELPSEVLAITTNTCADDAFDIDF